jgi:phosphate transport system permease protein
MERMATTLENDTARLGEPAPPVRPVAMPTRMAPARQVFDRGARWFVTLGGIVIICAILAILLVIVLKVYPLFVPPGIKLLKTIDSGPPAPCLAVGIDDYLEVGWLVTPNGIRVIDWKGERSFPDVIPPALARTRAVSVCAPSAGHLAIGLADGRILPVDLSFDVQYSEDAQGNRVRTVTPRIEPKAPVTVTTDPRELRLMAYQRLENTALMAAVTTPTEVTLVKLKEKAALTGGITRSITKAPLAVPDTGAITAVAIDPGGETLYAGTSTGRVLRWDLTSIKAPKLEADVQATAAGVQSLGFLNGGRTLILGDAVGAVSTWQYVRERDREVHVLSRIHAFESQAGRILASSASQRNRGFATLDETGAIYINYGTTGQTQLKVPARAGVTAVAYAPKANGIVTGDAAGQAQLYELNNPHPEITAGSLFGRLWYEGYEEPQFAWQSSGATDDAEPKLSLIPLLVGTLKGTFYALLFAIPIALLSALYTSQFMHPNVKNVVKPTVEVMAALPSVVLGFIGGLWLAPYVERLLPSIAAGFLIAPTLILLSLLVWRQLPQNLRLRFKPGTEVFLLIPVILAAGLIAHGVGFWVEQHLLTPAYGGDYKRWLLDRLRVSYDQRNSIVVGFAMGFAIIPIIFTIAEDSLANVPRHLLAGSLALGATRWQTAIRVVLPTASPGIFSAIMIGFGRSVGETMIVLMATGNTPITDWSSFNGFRALSANIAVELPEAPQDGTLYRLLFLTALMLFVITFLVNTAAEVVRLRLRKRYRAI